MLPVADQLEKLKSLQLPPKLKTIVIDQLHSAARSKNAELLFDKEQSEETVEYITLSDSSDEENFMVPKKPQLSKQAVSTDTESTEDSATILEFNGSYNKSLRVAIFGSYHEEDRWYVAKFENSNGEKTFRFESKDKFFIPLDPSTDLQLIAFEYFKQTLQKYHRTLKQLHIDKPFFNRDFDNCDLEISSLENLNVIHINEVHQNFAKQIIKASGKALCDVTVVATPNNSKIELHNFPQIYKVTEMLDCNQLRLDYKQFLDLSASEIRIHIGEITPKDINRIVELYIVGRIRKSLKCCKFHLQGSNFREQEMWALLGEEEENLEYIYAIDLESNAGEEFSVCVRDGCLLMTFGYKLK